MKRMIALILSLLLCMSLMAGCGNTTTSAPKSVDAPETGAPESDPGAHETEPAAEANAYPLTDEEVSFSMWTLVAPPALAAADTLDGYNYAIKRAEELTNVHVDWILQSPLTAMESFNIMVSSGTYADFVNGFAGNYTAGPASAIDDGIIYSLNDYLQFMPNYTAAMDKYSAMKDVKTDDGDVYGIATLYDSEEPNWLGLAVRQDWLDELKLDAPETIGEYENVLTAFVNNYESCANGALWIAPLVGNVRDYSWSSAFDTAIGSPYASYNGFFANDGVVEYGPINAGYKDFISLMSDWYAKGLIYQDFMTAETIDTVTADVNGVTAGTYGIMNLNTDNLTAAAASGGDGFELAPLAYPVREKGQKLHLGMAPKSVDCSTSITTVCEDVELACKYWDWFFTDEAIEFCNYGVEGETFTRNADGSIQYTDMITSRDSMGGFGEWFYLMRSTFPGIYATSFRALYGKTELEISARRLWTATGGWDSMLPLGMTLTSDEGGTVSAVIADISTFVTECTLKFVTGEKSMDEFDEFVQQIQSMGIQDVVDAYQAAYDRYLER